MIYMTDSDIDTAKTAIKDQCANEEELQHPHCCMDGAAFIDALGGLVNEGEENESVKNLDKFKEMKPHLKAIAMSTPESSYLLVTALKASDACVATVAENTKDVRMMQKSDVGFAAGISGTQAILSASDFIL